MNKGINKTVLLGTVITEPEYAIYENDKKRASFTMVTNEFHYSQNGRYEHTEYHKAIAWGSLAEMISKNFHKGINIYAEGRNRTRSWEVGPGEKKYITEVLIDTVVMLPSKKKETKIEFFEDKENFDLPF